MTQANLKDYRLGWVGTGRMGYAMAARLLKSGCDVAVYNRTRARAESLAEFGAVIVDPPAALAGRDIVFTMVSGPDDLIEVVTGSKGVLSRSDQAPKLLVDCSSVSTEASATVREKAAARGVAMLAAPVSGNAKVVKAGLLSLVASGPEAQFKIAEPYLALLGRGVSYVGEGELGATVKIFHNILLSVETQTLADVKGFSDN